MKTAGLVTAAGASRRMGSPKALLTLPDGRRLAAAQAQLLVDGGCAEAAVVVGAAAERIAAGLPDCRVIHNPDWATGRLSSVRAGIGGFPYCDGVLILPVDAVGVAVATVRQVLAAAESAEGEVALRAVCQGQPGHLVWLSRLLMDRLLAASVEADTPLNAWLAPWTQAVETGDAALLRNLNTPADWQAFLDGGESG
jgi:CTP:molybdopterin cytidylyltransferase MocA